MLKKDNIKYRPGELIKKDLHSHVLPGIDDGSPTMEESLKMLNLFIDLGYTKIITTPHVVNAWYPNTKEVILGQYYNLLDRIEQKNLPITLEVSAEYRLEPELSHQDILPIAKDRILVELPWTDHSLPDTRLLVPATGPHQPILAHPERHTYLSIDQIRTLSSQGILFQLNLLSLLGRYGRPIQKRAETMVKKGLVDYVGSDAHNSDDLKELRKLGKNKYFRELMESGNLRNSEL